MFDDVLSNESVVDTVINIKYQYILKFEDNKYS